MIITSKIPHCLMQENFALDQPATTNFQHPTSKVHFLTAHGRSKEKLFTPRATQENLELTFLRSKFSSLDLHQKRKDEIFDSPSVRHPRIKPETQKMRFHLALNKAFCSKPPPTNSRQLEHSKLQKLQN